MKAFVLPLIFLLIVVPSTYAVGTWTTIDVPGSTHTAAYRINNSGQIVGFYDDSNYAAHGFLYSNGSFTTIDFPGATATYELGINDSGTIVGLYGFKLQSTHGFLFDGKTFTTIDYPGGFDTAAWDINDFGVVVGTYTDAITFDQIGFELSGGTYLTIQPPGTKRVSAYGINNAGGIVGVASFRGFVYSRGKYMQELNFPQATFTTLNDLNDSQKVVGQASTRLGEVKGFGYLRGDFAALEFPNVVFTQAWGINKRGEIVGFYVDGNGREHGFLHAGGGNE
jgi:probable HAF family extracellular repeat protein